MRLEYMLSFRSTYLLYLLLDHLNMETTQLQSHSKMFLERMFVTFSARRGTYSGRISNQNI